MKRRDTCQFAEEISYWITDPILFQRCFAQARVLPDAVTVQHSSEPSDVTSPASPH